MHLEACITDVTHKQETTEYRKQEVIIDKGSHERMFVKKFSNNLKIILSKF
jgi:hypothetical protein